MLFNTKILEANGPGAISVAASALRRGQLVAFPTETVYGLGAIATSAKAVAGIFEAKQRPTFDPLIVHIAERAQLSDVVTHIPPLAMALADAFWPGPLTLVLPKQPTIPDLVTAGLPGVGVRIPAHPVALELLKAVGLPVAAPSANPFGGISPTTAMHVADGLNQKVHLILDGGPCRVGVESTVVSFMGDRPVLLRPGGCALEELEAVIGPIDRAAPNAALDDAAQPAPGMLSRHYAPATPLTVVARNSDASSIEGLKCGLLTYGKQPFSGSFVRIERLEASEDLQTCASRFFAALRSLDSCGLDVIIAHTFPDHGLGIALNDRLQRAACRS
jgi:L-threonylcarbamoyladenylate synthase